MRKQMVPLIAIYRSLRGKRLTADDKRNLRLGGIVSVYGVMFAVEKALIVFGVPQPDWEWMWIYGMLAMIATYWWIDDYLRDLWERENKP